MRFRAVGAAAAGRGLKDTSGTHSVPHTRAGTANFAGIRAFCAGGRERTARGGKSAHLAPEGENRLYKTANRRGNARTPVGPVRAWFFGLFTG